MYKYSPIKWTYKNSIEIMKLCLKLPLSTEAIYSEKKSEEATCLCPTAVSFYTKQTCILLSLLETQSP